MKSFIIISILLCFAGTVFPADKTVLSEEKAYQKLSKEMDFWVNSPIIMEDEIIFFYRGDAKKVFVAGDFNGWKPNLLMTLKDTNFFQVFWDERIPKGVHHYRLLVDDIWINDPQNTNQTMDAAGQMVSCFTLEEEFIPFKKYPLWLQGQTYRFIYENPKVRNVALVGDFNHWNPYTHPLKYIGAGQFVIEFDIKPGFYAYCFVADNEWVPDGNNIDQYSDNTGRIVNVFHARDGKKPFKEAPKKH